MNIPLSLPPFHKLKKLIFAILLTLAIIVSGGFLIGTTLEDWYENLIHPWYLIPSPLFILINIWYFVICIIALYRAFCLKETKKQQDTALAIILMMLLNEAWHLIFFRFESTLAGFIGIIIFAFFVFNVLVKFSKNNDSVSFYLFLPYLLWVFYDIAWTYGLWTLNS